MRGDSPSTILSRQIKARLRNHLKEVGFNIQRDGSVRPRDDSKEHYRDLHRAQRAAILAKNRHFIDETWPRFRSYFAQGTEVHPTEIRPELELVTAATWQSDLFRLASLTWSVPVSQGYGRRLRFLVWDASNRKLMGLIAIGDPAFNLRDRDRYIDWSVRWRRSRLVNVMDAYVLGAIPPYNLILCGKLVACLIRTKEVKGAFRKRYANFRGVISGRKKHPNLVAVTTTSALGKSAVLDRLRLGKTSYFRLIGTTDGWGHFHIPDETFGMIRSYLALRHHAYSKGNRFGDGPNWKLRAVRQALSMMDSNVDVLRHGIAREIYICELARNAKQVLSGQRRIRPDYRGLLTVAEVSTLAKERWIVPRAARRPEYAEWKREGIASLLCAPALDETTGALEVIAIRGTNDVTG